MSTDAGTGLHAGPAELRARFAPILDWTLPSRDEWLRRIVDGAIVGNATSERTGTTLTDIATTVRPAGDGDGDDGGAWTLDGRKFSSTGTISSDWISLAAGREARDGSVERVTFAVPTDAPGVTTVDAGAARRLRAVRGRRGVRDRPFVGGIPPGRADAVRR